MSVDDRKKLVCQHIDLSWNKGCLALAEQLHSKDFLYKSSFVGQHLGSVAFSQLVQDIRNAMPDLQVVVEECIAEGNKVGYLEHPDRHHREAGPRLPAERQGIEHRCDGLLDADPK